MDEGRDVEAGQLDGRQLLDQIVDIWIAPEAERRGLTGEDLAALEQLTIVLAPETEHALVLLGDEAAVDLATPHQPQPSGISPDAAWVCCALVGDEMLIAFDFRRYRGWAAELSARAREFSAAARRSLDDSALAPAIECAVAAAELAVKAIMAVVGQEQRSPERLRGRHQYRQQWLTEWAGLGNARSEHAEAFVGLYAQRPAARYGEHPIGVTLDVVSAWLDDVDDLIAVAAGLASTSDASEAPA